MSFCLPVKLSALAFDMISSPTHLWLHTRRSGHRIDSPVHKNAKLLLNKNLTPAGNSAYKPAYKQKRNNVSNEGQKQFGKASSATMAKMYADISFEDMQNGLNGLYQ